MFIKNVSTAITPCNNGGFMMSVVAIILDSREPENSIHSQVNSAIQVAMSGGGEPRENLRRLEFLFHCENEEEIGEKTIEVLKEIDLVSRGADF